MVRAAGRTFLALRIATIIRPQQFELFSDLFRKVGRLALEQIGPARLGPLDVEAEWDDRRDGQDLEG